MGALDVRGWLKLVAALVAAACAGLLVQAGKGGTDPLAVWVRANTTAIGTVGGVAGFLLAWLDQTVANAMSKAGAAPVSTEAIKQQVVEAALLHADKLDNLTEALREVPQQAADAVVAAATDRPQLGMPEAAPDVVKVAAWPDNTATPTPPRPTVTVSVDPVAAAIESYNRVAGTTAEPTYPVAYVPRVDVDPEAAP